jgi:RimJ/RimL family protein N-acetyltransferase
MNPGTGAFTTTGRPAVTPPRSFQTRRLFLRWPVIEDARAIFEDYATDTEVTRYLTWLPHRELGTVVDFLSTAIARNESGDSYCWALTLPGDDRVIGMLAARVGSHMTNIGYVLARKHWGNGYMPEAVSQLSGWLLQQPGMFRVWAVCDTANVASTRTLEKSNFEREGLLRRWIIHSGCSSEPRDCYVYGRAR